nr:putative pentatricopeptide repeat-containing protein [Ipomoea batatas]GME21770.1 putative pentatricopeptide repeat-containing protein [Ipomoea batatas]
MQLLCHLRGESSIDDPEDVAILVGTYVGSAIVFPQVAKESDVVELNSSLLSITQFILLWMGTRVPVQHYDLRSAAASYIGSSLHDLNAAEGLGGAGDDVDRGGGDVTEDSLDNDEESTAVVSITFSTYFC